LFRYLEARPAHTLVGLVVFIVAYSIYFSDARFTQSECIPYDDYGDETRRLLVVQSLAWGRSSKEIQFEYDGLLIHNIFLPYGRDYDDIGKITFGYNEQAKKGILKITFPPYGDSYSQGGIKRDCWQMIRTYLSQGISEDQIIEN
jgi:hypothetical protein